MLIGICDDIKEYRSSVKAFVSEYFKINKIDFTIDEYSNGEDLLNSRKAYDILFIDIELGGIDGIELTKALQKKYKKTLFIIVTAYIKYLDKAIDINVLRYIDKPVSQERVFSALDKAMNTINNNSVIVQTTDNEFITIEKTDIIYAEAKLRRTQLVTSTGTLNLKNSISELKEKLNASFFASPHNSYIINMNCIKSFNRNEIKLAVGEKEVMISIATRKQHEFKTIYFNFVGEDY